MLRIHTYLAQKTHTEENVKKVEWTNNGTAKAEATENVEKTTNRAAAAAENKDV